MDPPAVGRPSLPPDAGSVFPDRTQPDRTQPDRTQPDRVATPGSNGAAPVRPARGVPDQGRSEREAPAGREPAPDESVTEQADEPRTSKPRHRFPAGNGREPLPARVGPDGKRARKPKTGRRRRASFWKELPLLIVVALMLTFLIQTFLAKVYVIPSGSMETTLHGCNGCVNDRVLVDKMVYRFRDPAPGDVVVFRGPDGWVNTEFTVDESDNILIRGLQQLGSLVGLAPPDEKDFVKRVIAVGGQTVQCCDSQNRVLVDGKPLTEPYVYYQPDLGPARQAAFGPVRVPDRQLWVMGDNRNNSADSRAQGHGAVPADLVIGKARWIVLPFGRLGGIPDPNPQVAAAAGGSAGVEPLAVGLLVGLPLIRWRRRASERPDELRWPGRR